MVTNKCVECRDTFLVESMIRHGNVYVCANCKPRFMQKLAEGATIQTGEMRYGGFWIRLGAHLLDGIFAGILMIGVIVLLFLAVGGISALEAGGDPGLAFIAGFYAVMFGIGISYETLLIGKYGATPGKMICQLRVVTADGGKVSYLLALGRYFAKILNGFTLNIGFIIAAFDDEKRGLHDRICNTRVVTK